MVSWCGRIKKSFKEVKFFETFFILLRNRNMKKLTKEQIEFLWKVVKSGTWSVNEKGEVDVDGDVYMRDNGFLELPVKFGRVKGWFDCAGNKLTTLKNAPVYMDGYLYCHNNNLKDYFKSIKEEDFKFWDKVSWDLILDEYPFMINIGKKYMDRDELEDYLNVYPLTKLYLE